jgi:hypothetical protein
MPNPILFGSAAGVGVAAHGNSSAAKNTAREANADKEAAGANMADLLPPPVMAAPTG